MRVGLAQVHVHLTSFARPSSQCCAYRASTTSFGSQSTTHSKTMCSKFGCHRLDRGTCTKTVCTANSYLKSSCWKPESVTCSGRNFALREMSEAESPKPTPHDRQSSRVQNFPSFNGSANTIETTKYRTYIEEMRTPGLHMHWNEK